MPTTQHNYASQVSAMQSFSLPLAIREQPNTTNEHTTKQNTSANKCREYKSDSDDTHFLRFADRIALLCSASLPVALLSCFVSLFLRTSLKDA
ncbi:hypothetical protein VNO80_19589 [Phaseolus coccineus]|uniref:Uncharacterized protein n=1 Tax=Phaseolus coccineus TaxID=3886 RepID=A0AAN9MHM0_PHACN